MKKKLISCVTSVALVLSLSGVLTGCAAGNSSSSSSSTSTETTTIDSSGYDFEYTDRDKDASYDEAEAVLISLADNATTVTAGASADSDATSNVTVDGNEITITAEGTYILSGTLSDGCVYVNTDTETKCQIVLNGVTITNADGPALYIEQADKCFVTLAEGSTNNLSDGSSYVLDEDEEPNGTIFSKDDLTINGTGTLNIKANYRHAISSKDDLVITGGVYNISAVEDGLRGKDCVKILDGTFNLIVGEDAIQSSNDSEEWRGFVSIDGGSFYIEAGDDGVHAETLMRITDGTVDIATCYEGYEGNQVEIDGGTTHIYATDDGLNAATGSSTGADEQMGDFSTDQRQDMQDAAGSFDPTQGDTVQGGGMQGGQGGQGGGMQGGDMGQGGDAPSMPSGDTATVSSGDAAAQPSGDGTAPSMPSGDTAAAQPSGDGATATAPDNAGQGDAQGIAQGGMTGAAEGGVSMSDDSCIITINGGYTFVEADGDGIDSNGSFSMTGGTLLVCGPVSSADGYFDYDSFASISGGTVLMVGSTGMAQNFTEGTQPFVFANASGSAGDTVALVDSDGTVLASFVAAKQFQVAVGSASALSEGESVSIVVGGTISGSTNDDGFTTSGSVSGGTSTSTTASTTATSGYGGLGSDGNPMAAGQHGGGFGGK